MKKGDRLSIFLQFVTVFAVNYLIFFAVYYYWRVNKRDGLFTLVSYYICIAINPLGISLLCHFCSSDGIFEKLSGKSWKPGLRNRKRARRWRENKKNASIILQLWRS